MSLYEKFRKASTQSDGEQFPDGFHGDVKIDVTKHITDGFYGERIVVEFESVDRKHRGALSLSLEGKGAVANMGRLKSLWVAALGFDPYVSAEVEKSGVNGDEAADIAKAAIETDLFKGHIVNARVAYKRNEKNESKPFVNFRFAPVLDAKGEPKRAA